MFVKKGGSLLFATLNYFLLSIRELVALIVPMKRDSCVSPWKGLLYWPQASRSVFVSKIFPHPDAVRQS